MIKFFGNWGRKEDGATAVEFSLLFMPYLLLCLGIIELSLMFTAESLLEGATTQAARQVKTGQLQNSGAADMEAEFRNLLCDHATVLINCEDIVIEARVMTSFGDFASMQPSFDEDGAMMPDGFDAGGSSDRILIRTFYRYNAFTPLVGPMLFGVDNSRNFISTIVLQSEPYDFQSELQANGEI